MPQRLSSIQVHAMLDRLRASVTKPECWTCDNLQAFLAQLERDAAEDAADEVSKLLAPLKVAREHGHRSLGCSPCTGGTLYSEYLKTLQRLDEESDEAGL